MNDNNRSNRTERGQTAVLFALMIIGLIAFVGLAVDGGNVLNERRITQNAADSAALTGVHYIVGSNAPNETRLQEVVNGVIESNGVPDTDSNPGNDVNANVAIFYTDERGVRLTDETCCTSGAPIPLTARGIEVEVDNQANTFFLGVINRETLDVGASAVAVVRGGSDGGNALDDNVLVAFGECTDETDIPLDFSGHFVDVIGGVHSSTWFRNRGRENHYHGPATYANAPTPLCEPGVLQCIDSSYGSVFEPAYAQATALGDPLAGLFTVEDFNCSTGDIGSNPGVICHNVAQYAPEYASHQYPAGVVNYRLMTQKPTREDPFLDPVTGELKPGIYYAGDFPMVFGWAAPDPEIALGMHGTVTFVTNSFIKITENDVQLTAYLPAGLQDLPRLLLYSGLDMTGTGKACTNHEELTDWEEPINTTGNAGSQPPKVYHSAEREGCVNLDNPSACYERGSLVYDGLIYAPGGRAATSGNGATYIGGILAYSIRVNGYVPYDDIYGCGTVDNPCRPIVAPEVGALFVRDSNLIPPTEQLIYLDR